VIVFVHIKRKERGCQKVFIAGKAKRREEKDNLNFNTYRLIALPANIPELTFETISFYFP